MCVHVWPLVLSLSFLSPSVSVILSAIQQDSVLHILWNSLLNNLNNSEETDTKKSVKHLTESNCTISIQDCVCFGIRNPALCKNVQIIWIF